MHVDIRSGFTFARFQGPSEQLGGGRDLEAYSFNTGVHLALGASYALSRNTSLKAELSYIQLGTNYEFNGFSYWLFPVENGDPVYSFGTRNEELEIVNTYLSMPLFYTVRTNRIELALGVGVSYLTSSEAEGRLSYSGLTENGTRVTPFTIDLNFDYLNDPFNHLPMLGDRVRNIDGQLVEIPRIIGAYYESTGVEVERFRRWDAQVIAGISFFLSEELFIGLRMSYGLTDITNNRQDMSIVRLTPDREIILTHDKDRNVAFHASVGLRF